MEWHLGQALGQGEAADPEVAELGAGQAEGQVASSAALLMPAPEHLPGTLGSSALVVMDYCLRRGLSGRDWIKNWQRPVRRGVLQADFSEDSFPLGIPVSHL